MGADIDVQNGKNCDYVEALQKYLFQSSETDLTHRPASFRVYSILFQFIGNGNQANGERFVSSQFYL